ncbi:hypothetical protein [Methylomonas methanica]|uniref:Uncharacterized protein n=1 Tax=Methylomonas methanica (strain DSM 25384 / MC09) TaxID=857087 RepID=F9ZXU7_METMM|nr:hypothetical protein [Methylomonas methanica]AEF98526.1 hypothetical protein Metme_0074 [Methylomonas methanica MC09]
MEITTESIVSDNDDIYWIFSSIENTQYISFYTEPYLARTEGFLPSKLIYTSSKPYQSDTASCELDYYCTMYRVAYKYRNSELIHVSDHEIQNAAFKLGLNKAEDIHSNLSNIKEKDINKIISSESFLKKFSNTVGNKIAISVAHEYKIDPEQIRITGGAQINGKVVESQHDLDVVVPIQSYNHAERVWERIKSKYDGFVIERGFISPMRWLSERESMICPFFIYDKLMEIPIVQMMPSEVIETRVVITDASLSIFNMPLFKVNGDIDFIAFRSRIARATLIEETNLNIKAPLIYISKGAWKGQKGVLITDPFKQISNLSEALSKWNA